MGTQVLLFFGNSPFVRYSTDRITINGVKYTGKKRAKITHRMLIMKNKINRFLIKRRNLFHKLLPGAFWCIRGSEFD